MTAYRDRLIAGEHDAPKTKNTASVTTTTASTKTTPKNGRRKKAA